MPRFSPTPLQEKQMRRFLLVLALLALARPVPARADVQARPAPVIDVVLCLDVSSSMNDLIDSAKVKLWDLVNELGTVRPTPRLRVGLYSYGHREYDARKGWVRKEVDLTDDLDTVYKQLNALRIAPPGSDEYVARVCRDAIAEQKWSADRKALKIIFVCGNEPADQDKEVSLESVARSAVEKDIVINTIYCRWSGPLPGEPEGWQNLAKMAEGRFAQIDMKKGTFTIATPQDRRLEELGAALNRTYVAYGMREVREEKVANQVAQDANAAKLLAAAGRASTKATGLYRNTEWDLVDRLKDDPNFDITKVPEAELCDELKKLKPAERVAYVQKKRTEREALQKEIAGLSTKRAEYLKEEMKKQEKEGDKAFDEAVRAALREQAARKDITIPK
jgi:hypothetical protein